MNKPLVILALVLMFASAASAEPTPSVSSASSFWNRAITHVERADTTSCSQVCTVEHSGKTPKEIVFIILIPVLVILSGILAGLTLGYMSLDLTALEVIAKTGTKKQKAQAEKVMPLRRDGHLVLITLILANMIVNETLPVISDDVLGGGIQAVVASTALIVIFSEIIPQSVCSRFGLAIGAKMVWPVRILIYIFYVVAKPVALLLGWILGDHAGVVYRRAELKELIAMHGDLGGHGGDLNTDVVTIVGATLDLQAKVVRDAMTPIDSVFQLPITSKLDYETLGKVLKAGHSRIPVYEEVHVGEGDAKQVKRRIIGVLLTKQLILLDPEDATPLANIPMNPLPTVSEDLSLLQILNTFQEGRSHMAIACRRKPVFNPLTGKFTSNNSANKTDSDAEKGEPESPKDSESGIRGLFHRKRKGSKSSKDSTSDDESGSDEATSAAKKEKGAASSTGLEAVSQHASRVSVNTLYALDDDFPVGLITLEDVLEELIGEEILDETDNIVNDDGTQGQALKPYIPPEAVGRLGPPPAPSAGAATKSATTPVSGKAGVLGAMNRLGKTMVRSRSAPGKQRNADGVTAGPESKAGSGSNTPSVVFSPAPAAAATGTTTPLTAEPATMNEPETLGLIAEHPSPTSEQAPRPGILRKPSETPAAVPGFTVSSATPTPSGTPPPGSALSSAGPRVPALLSDAILLERGRRLLVAEGADPASLPPLRLAAPQSRPTSRSGTPRGNQRLVSVPPIAGASPPSATPGAAPVAPVKKGTFKSPSLPAPIPVRTATSRAEVKPAGGTSAQAESSTAAGPAPSAEEKKAPSPDSGFPPLRRADVLACVFSSWYPAFKKHSPKASIIKPLTPTFIDYLQADGVFLPEGSGPLGLEELSDSEEESDDEDEQPKFSFPELDAEIRRVLLKYDGAVFPKLNWSSPQDASWMVPGPALKCQCPADIYLLLKSSDFISHDLDHAFDNCVDSTHPNSPATDAPQPSSPVTTTAADLAGPPESLYRNPALETSDEEADEGEGSRREPRKAEYEMELVLKKWFDMPRSSEWRCFVRDRKLLAISQRDPNYYAFLQPSEFQDELRAQVSRFFATAVRDKFTLASYTFDIYLTRSGDRLFLIDFNPYAPTTDSLLLPWDAIHSLASDPARELPVVATVEDAVTQPLPSFSHNRYPKDVVQLSDGASVAEFAKEWEERLKEAVVDELDAGAVVGR